MTLRRRATRWIAAGALGVAAACTASDGRELPPPNPETTTTTSTTTTTTAPPSLDSRPSTSAPGG